jgi:hypothetical protein
LVCWFRMGSLVFAGLAGSDRWPSSMSGTECWAAPAIYFIVIVIGPCRAALARSDAVLAQAQCQRRGRSGRPVARPGQKAVALSAFAPWRSCGPLFLAALPLNDSAHLYAMPKMQTALQIALSGFTEATPGTTLQ